MQIYRTAILMNCKVNGNIHKSKAIINSENVKFQRFTIQLTKVYLLVNSRRAARAGNEAAETKDDRAVPQSNQRYILKQTTQSHQETMETNLRLLIPFFFASILFLIRHFLSLFTSHYSIADF